jgi:hypothetical protein
MVPIVEKIFEDCGVIGFWFLHDRALPLPEQL